MIEIESAAKQNHKAKDMRRGLYIILQEKEKKHGPSPAGSVRARMKDVQSFFLANATICVVCLDQTYIDKQTRLDARRKYYKL